MRICSGEPPGLVTVFMAGQRRAIQEIQCTPCVQRMTLRNQRNEHKQDGLERNAKRRGRAVLSDLNFAYSRRLMLVARYKACSKARL